MKKLQVSLVAVTLASTMLFGCGGSSTTSETASSNKESTASSAVLSSTETESKSTSAASASSATSVASAASSSSADELKASDGFPNKEFTMYLDSDPGTETYTIMSEFAKYFEKYSGQKLNLEAYEGSSGVLALNEMMKQDADGYSMLHQSITLPLTIGFGTAPFKQEEVQPIAGMYGDSLVVSVLPDSKFQSIDDIVKYAKMNPGKFNWGGAKTKAAIQVGSAMFWNAADIDVNYVAYDSGNDALVAVLGGNTMCNASSVSGALDYYKDGKLKVLAVSSKERRDVMPDVPTFEELGYPEMTGYSIFRGSYTKAGIPEDHLKVLENIHKKISEDPDWQEYLASINKENDYRGTEEYTRWYNDTIKFTGTFDFG